MNFDSTSISLSNACKFLIFLIPISMIVGNAAININIILLDIFFLILIYLKKIRLSRDIQIFSLVLLSLLVLNTFASSNQIWSLKAWLGFIKHYVLFLCLIFILSEEKFKLNFLKFLFILLLFISVDTYIQYFFGKDIFGYELDLQHGKRLSGPFGDEYVVGGYIAKFFFISLIYLLLAKYKFVNLMLYSIFILIIVFLSQERSAFITLFCSICFFYFFYDMKIKSKIIFFVLSIIFLSIILKFDQTSYKKYINLTGKQLGITKKEHYHDHSTRFKIKTFWDSRYGAHFLTSYEIFKDHKFLGGGARNFRYLCSDKKYSKIESAYAFRRCNTHPHNIHFEILSETGLFGFLIFLFSIIFLFWKNLQYYFSKKNKNLYLINITLLLLTFFPLQTTGAFFSTYNGIFYWIILSIVIINSKLNFFSSSQKEN